MAEAILLNKKKAAEMGDFILKKYERIFVIVLDSLGIGAMPDSEKFGDVGVDTFGHILDKMGSLEIPNLRKLGMLNLHEKFLSVIDHRLCCLLYRQNIRYN